MAYSLILSTAPSKNEAQTIARALVERRLVACVNIVGPIDSVYRWKDEVESAQEFLMVIKTESAYFEKVQNTIRQLHSYELPEVIEVDIKNGSPEYLKWISESVGG